MPKPIKNKRWKKDLKAIQKEMVKKVGLFNRMGDECLTCGAPFDKKDAKMVKSWHVVIRKEQEIVNLYCPECWNSALKTLEGLDKHLKRETNEDIQ